MGIAALLHRTGLVVLQVPSIRPGARGQRRTAAIRTAPVPAAPNPRKAPPLGTTTPVSLWDADEGEPTWEDAEWQ